MSERRGEIQWLRAVAALEVVAVHSDLATKHIARASILQGWYPTVGGIGVEVFFVVSGFIMCMVASRAPSAGSFMLGRIRRIIPLCVLFTSLAALIHYTSAQYLISPTDITLGTLIRSYLALPQWQFPILGPTWTLEHEMIFYEIVAATLLLGALTRARKLALAALVVALGGLGCWLGPRPEVSVWTFHVASPYMLAFGFGWLLRCCEEGSGGGRVAIAAACLAATSVAVVVGNAWSDHLVLRIGIATLLCAIVLLGRRVLSADCALNRLAWRLGDASFSLYLTHWFILSASGKLAGVAAIPEDLSLLVRLGAILIAVAVGVIAYRVIEVPIEQFLRGGLPGRKPLPQMARP
ncbi:acyltransferase family protein [Methylobacterium nodulans]|uniref:Acyltransferase 3 n=1 Tax=Methylobacterium nodulans (strain LMG 21967 / CNCM I-2342 / ORS 2060) TaxID=460265 RepID=B8IPB4_METNO|nr:acyltransferase [Methylobacterium nodulans]ACL60432.1 acyltransferase 3 [Methylobacterium nodulans ORS 2060]